MEPFEACKKCFIHVGFHADYHLNERKINEHVASLIKSNPVNKIVLTGHSLGAALASINAIYLAIAGVQIPLEVYNFGSPRFAN
jgi:putative lipase involved disintegration of autophagic bodies